jgi:hypothetical protein
MPNVILLEGRKGGEKCERKRKEDQRLMENLS